MWERLANLSDRVRNMTRRGYLLATYNDGKLLKARVKTGVDIENDKIDVMHPVGFMARVKPSPKTEVITLDIGGDTSRRVVLMIIGDRETHPQPDDDEVFCYAPGDKEMFVRVKAETAQASRVEGDSGRPSGIHSDAKGSDISSTTKANNTTTAGGNVQVAASKVISRGESHNEGTMFVEGSIHAGDVVAGGGTNINTGRSGGAWTANGRPGSASLIQTAAQVGTVAGQLMNFEQGQGQQNAQTNQQIQELLERVAALEAKVP